MQPVSPSRWSLLRTRRAWRPVNLFLGMSGVAAVVGVPLVAFSATYLAGGVALLFAAGWAVLGTATTVGIIVRGERGPLHDDGQNLVLQGPMRTRRVAWSDIECLTLHVGWRRYPQFGRPPERARVGVRLHTHDPNRLTWDDDFAYLFVLRDEREALLQRVRALAAAHSLPLQTD